MEGTRKEVRGHDEVLLYSAEENERANIKTDEDPDGFFQKFHD